MKLKDATPSEDIGNDASGSDAGHSTVLIAFAAGLNAELDALGFAKGSGRTNALAKLLGLTRTQPYRMLKGLSAPGPEAMATLRAFGVSFDRIIDRVNRTMPAPIEVILNGETVSVLVQRAAPGADCAAALLPLPGGGHSLILMQPGDALPENAVGLQSMEFVARTTLAIVEDDPTTLDLLKREMSERFSVSAFENAKSLFSAPSGISRFNSFLIDWRLPDMDGEELVKRIRATSSAPIFILTSDSGESSVSIARAMDFDDVHHATKPAQAIILSKRISTAVKALQQA